MHPVNRIQDYYDVACEYLSLPFDARIMLGHHFKVLRDISLNFDNRDAMDAEVFKAVFEKNIYAEFKKFTHHYKKSRSHEHFIGL
jgi:hypothetical protein